MLHLEGRQRRVSRGAGSGGLCSAVTPSLTLPRAPKPGATPTLHEASKAKPEGQAAPSRTQEGPGWEGPQAAHNSSEALGEQGGQVFALRWEGPRRTLPWLFMFQVTEGLGGWTLPHLAEMLSRGSPEVSHELILYLGGF